MRCPLNPSTLGNFSFYCLIINSHVIIITLRATIIGSYHANGGHAFWAIALRQPLQENRITGIIDHVFLPHYSLHSF